MTVMARNSCNYIGQNEDEFLKAWTLSSLTKNGNITNRYIGTFSKGQLNGDAAAFTYDSTGKEKSRLYGSWRNGEFIEEKPIEVADGDSYTGEWLNGQKHGSGIYTWGKKSKWFGAKYLGNFQYDKKSGHGSLILPSGDKYVGI
jgi:hypothetical protein